MDPLPLPSTSSSSGSGGSSGGGSSAKSANTDDANTGIEDENVLLLVFRSINFDPRVVSVAACVSRRLRAVAGRVLWRELCASRAPRMASSLGLGGGGWQALAKVLFYCCGSGPQIGGHFAAVSRFSKTSGRSFVQRRWWAEDVVYVSDPCEHAVVGGEEDVGLYRGVFRGFMRSRTRAWLVGRGARLEGGGARCPYCGAGVWSMAAAGLVPRTAGRRLGSHDGNLEYFVCVYGHLHGNCWLAHLSDDAALDSCTDDDDDDDDGRVAF